MTELAENSQTKRDLSISLAMANVFGILTPLPFVAVFIALYLLFYGWASFWQGLGLFFDRLLLFVLIFIAGVLVHEGLHAVTWIVAGRKQASAVKFGFMWKVLTPYAHLQVPIQAGAYRWGSAMPGLVLGFLPAIIGLLAESSAFLWFGIFFTMAAGGDFLVLWIIRNVEGEKYVEDHPTRAGCFVYD